MSYRGLSIRVFMVCAAVLLGISAWGQATGDAPPQSKKKETVYTFAGEELTGKGKGPSNVFLKVGVMKKRKLLEMRTNFREELRRSLKLVK